MAIAQATDSIPLKLSHFAIVLAAGASTCKTSLPWDEGQVASLRDAARTLQIKN
ncbi:MAG: hypothetical protein KME50_16320 [Nostoc desertorum CM1-VF14]|jgi:hypothetical protein|nr:hypothetical protein [Nostoc desertorum CM1-VF14]